MSPLNRRNAVFGQVLQMLLARQGIGQPGFGSGLVRGGDRGFIGIPEQPWPYPAPPGVFPGRPGAPARGGEGIRRVFPSPPEMGINPPLQPVQPEPVFGINPPLQPVDGGGGYIGVPPGEMPGRGPYPGLSNVRGNGLSRQRR